MTKIGKGGDGIKKWVSRGDSVLDEDIVVWIQFGLNHVPRIEDFPVMYTLSCVLFGKIATNTLLGRLRSSEYI